MYKVTIIIPHYNSLNTLKILVDSIPDLKEIQVIVVDDKSDCGLDQVKEAASGKKRADVMVFRNESPKKGAGVCRNLALNHAEGEWLLFADADDYYMPDMWEIISAYLDTEYDIVYFKPISYVLGTTERSDKRGRFYEKIIDLYLRDACNRYNEMRMRYSWYVPWSKLIRMEIIVNNGISFDETIVANDVMFSAKCGYYANKIAADERIIYCVTEQTGTLTQTINEEWFDIRINSYIRRNEFMKQRLSEEEMKTFRFSGTFLILKALKEGYGVTKAHQLMKLFDENDIRYSKKAVNKEFPEV